ncbi:MULTISPECIES: lipid A biosynthesis acyltransferase [unclassified Capnocytophaga]|jgi:lipid A biosynthesis acyltransferase|uniref:LpxL/LpxP family acyltransferase n=1 Tax=unclassified Capnocytophaga TaxID=2640652 RepID=UPI000202B2CC|nr:MULTISPECIES: lipid A biosynthesis acyltransferase [unclassified Capnocytophaga]EGD35177.1 lipid A biosynthesis acyltransferase [Capnocytophaga sp. oral taxon 338 str. F0234]MEB3003797.1 lipid A biosynthesis acyltransferase [Capnocytophaga sp. G2]
MQKKKVVRTKWQGKSKGNVLGYRIFVFLIKYLGIRSAYVLLIFVAFYYFLSQWKSNGYLYRYFHRRLGYSPLKAFVSVYRNYFVFGQTIIDKVAIFAQFHHQFTYEFDGVELLRSLLQRHKGGILISAHIGNFEVAELFFRELDVDCQIHTVTTDMERSAIKEYLEGISLRKYTPKFIFVKEDMSHIFEISDALQNNGIICLTGDRYFEGTKYLRATLLGKETHFPAGPFMIASRLGVPVIFVYVMKEKNLHYHLYARMAQAKHRDAQGLLNAFTENMEQMLRKYPLQWFNYFDFWEEDEKEA